MDDRAKDLHNRSIVIIGHSDIIASDVDWRRESGARRVLEERHFPTLKRGGATVFCDHIGGDAPYGYLPATNLKTTFVQRFMRALDHTYNEVAESDHFIIARSTDDIRRAKAEDKIAIVICLEGGAPLENEISYLRNFHRLGLRCLGLTHDIRNELADGILERSAGGLTYFGVDVVRECNRLGVVIDVSHLSDKGTQEVLEISTEPITASHSNARALCDIPRNLPDYLIRGIASKGGVIGFHAKDGFISQKARPSFEDMMAHIMRIVELGGPDCIAIGPDLMENWEPEVFTSVYDRSSKVCGIPTGSITWTYPPGMQSNAELGNISEWLLRRNTSEADVIKLLGGNLLRLFDTVWK